MAHLSVVPQRRTTDSDQAVYECLEKWKQIWQCLLISGWSEIAINFFNNIRQLFVSETDGTDGLVRRDVIF